MCNCFERVVHIKLNKAPGEAVFAWNCFRVILLYNPRSSSIKNNFVTNILE